MKAAAFRHAEGGHYSPEMRLKQYIEMHGVEAVTGRRILWAHEIFRMNCAQNIVMAYEQRRRAESWVEWARENPILAAMLAEAEKLAGE